MLKDWRAFRLQGKGPDLAGFHNVDRHTVNPGRKNLVLLEPAARNLP